MKLVKEYLSEKALNEDHHGDPNDESSMARNQLKNVMKNAQAMLDLISGGQQLDAWVQSHLAVVNDKLQDAKNYMENEATENPGMTSDDSYDRAEFDISSEPQVIEPLAIGGMDSPGMDSPEMEGPEDGMMGSDMDLLPPPFPEDEIEPEGEDLDIDGDGESDFNILDVETVYGDNDDGDLKDI